MSNYLKCPKCGGDIQQGTAIDPGYHSCLITYENLELISVFKCKSCGYSCDDYRDLIWNEEND